MNPPEELIERALELEAFRAELPEGWIELAGRAELVARRAGVVAGLAAVDLLLDVFAADRTRVRRRGPGCERPFNNGGTVRQRLSGKGRLDTKRPDPRRHPLRQMMTPKHPSQRMMVTPVMPVIVPQLHGQQFSSRSYAAQEY